METEKETPVLEWDPVTLIEGMLANAKIDRAEELASGEVTEAELLAGIQEDYEAFEIAREELNDQLTEIMQRLNPDGRGWRAEVKNFGWRALDGYKEFEAEDGQKLLEQILPQTECVFKIYDRGDHIAINNAHHDSPVFAEWYTVRAVQPEPEEGDEEEEVEEIASIPRDDGVGT